MDSPYSDGADSRPGMLLRAGRAVKQRDRPEPGYRRAAGQSDQCGPGSRGAERHHRHVADVQPFRADDAEVFVDDRVDANGAS